MKIFDSEAESIEACAKTVIHARFIILNDYDNWFIIDRLMGYCGEDKQHWSDPLCSCLDLEDAKYILDAVVAIYGGTL